MTKNGVILIERRVDCAIVHFANSDLPKEVKGEEWGSVGDCCVLIMYYGEKKLAPTNKAAPNINGSIIIHCFLKMDAKRKY